MDLRGLGRRPVGLDRAIVIDDFTVATPHKLNSFRRSDGTSTRITSRAKPVVLWRASGTSTNTIVCRAVDSIGEDMLLKGNVVRDDRCSQVSFHAFQHAQDSLNVGIRFVLRDDLKWSKDFCRDQVKVLGLGSFFERHKDSRGFNRTVAGRNRMVL